MVNKLNQALVHIVSKPHLNLVESQYYHMCLAHLVLKDEEYASFYRRMSDEGKYVIMDNGAAEGEQLNLRDLALACERVNPAEVVLLDTMGESKTTLFKSYYCAKFLRDEGVTAKFMAVIHGTSMEDLVYCADDLLKMDIDTLGIPKVLTKMVHPDARMNLVGYLEKRISALNKKIDIHLLGCEKSFGEPITIMNKYPMVRSCDTALGFLITKNKQEVTLHTTRPRGVGIDFIEDTIDADLLGSNILKINQILGEKK